MITGLDEQYRIAVAVSDDRTEKYEYTALELFGWRVTFSNGMMIYERGPIDPITRRMSGYGEVWREPVGAIRSLQITPTRQFDNARVITSAFGFKCQNFMAYFGLRQKNLPAEPKKHPWDNKHESNLASWKREQKAPIPLPVEFLYHAKLEAQSLVLFAFLSDGSRRLISQREELTNTIDGTRGYDALLSQQTALMRGVQNERRAKIKNKEIAIERSLYL